MPIPLIPPNPLPELSDQRENPFMREAFILQVGAELRHLQSLYFCLLTIWTTYTRDEALYLARAGRDPEKGKYHLSINVGTVERFKLIPGEIRRAYDTYCNLAEPKPISQT